MSPQTNPNDEFQFIIVSPDYTECSSGARALHRLCHLLNRAGYRAGILTAFGSPEGIPTNPSWDTPVIVGHSIPREPIIIYPEVYGGNFLRAERVVRWVLNYPGVIGGDLVYDSGEQVFVWDERMLDRVSRSVQTPLTHDNVLKVAVIDPKYIYPDPSVQKEVDAYFIYKGRDVRKRFKMPNESSMVCIDETVQTQWQLGNLLRKTRRVFSYDHATILLHEAMISGCEIYLVHDDGLIVEARTCSLERRQCSMQETTSWPAGDIATTYRSAWADVAPVHGFVRSLKRKGIFVD